MRKWRPGWRWRAGSETIPRELSVVVTKHFRTQPGMQQEVEWLDGQREVVLLGFGGGQTGARGVSALPVGRATQRSVRGDKHAFK